jgi:hypothetical protein
MTFLVEIGNDYDSNYRSYDLQSPHQYAIQKLDSNTNTNTNAKVYLSRVSFKEINALNGLHFLNDFLSQICNYCKKTIKNETKNDYRTILICGHHYHTECICNCSTDHINIVRCMNCFEKMDKIKEIVKSTYSTYDITDDNIGYIVNNIHTNNYPLLYKRKIQK